MKPAAGSSKKMSTNAAKKQITCEICKAILKSQVYYQRHMEAKHPANPLTYTCDFDGKVFSAKNYLRIHMERHKEEVLICNVCCRAYNSRVSFRRHLLSHLEKFACSQCSASFAHKSLLNNHVASMHHMNEMPFKCKYCTRMFASKSARNNHHHQMHKGKSELSFKCQECKTLFFETKEDLRIHSFVHYEGDIKTCHVCEQIFKSTRMLNIHLQKHSTSKFQCEQCLEYFVFKSGLKKHIRLNRCKGPPATIIEKETDGGGSLTESEIQEIAKSQLKEISQRDKVEVKPLKITAKKEEEEDDDEETRKVGENDQNNEQFQLEDDSDGDDNARAAAKLLLCDKEPLKQQRVGRAHLTYTCDRCGESIKFRKNLESHMRERHLRNAYKCCYCSATFKSRRLYKEHTLEVHGIKERIAFEKYECEICKRKFDIRSIYLTHKLSHEDVRMHKCEICDASFKSVGNLKRHQSIHRETRDYLCDVCAKSFKTKPALKIHRAIHADFHVYVNCPYCKTICKEKNLKVHIFNQHSERGQTKPHECEACKKCFKNEFLLRRHARAVHENVSLGVVYKCQDCDMAFNRQKDLRTHSFEHYKGQIFSCKECEKKFKNKRLLLHHSQVHLHASIKFACNLCDAAFQTAGGRRKHIARHHHKAANVESIEFVENFSLFQ